MEHTAHRHRPSFDVRAHDFRLLDSLRRRSQNSRNSLNLLFPFVRTLVRCSFRYHQVFLLFLFAIIISFVSSRVSFVLHLLATVFSVSSFPKRSGRVYTYMHRVFSYSTV